MIIFQAKIVTFQTRIVLAYESNQLNHFGLYINNRFLLI